MSLQDSDSRFRLYSSASNRPKDFVDLNSRTIEVISEGDLIGLLVPVSEGDLEDPQSIRLLCEWRNKAGSIAFKGNEETNSERTKKWLKEQVLFNENRVLFWVMDKFGTRKIGHLGLALHSDDPKTIELDNVVRGDSSDSGIMSMSVEAIERFAERRFGFSRIRLRVLKKNKHARFFYEKLGYSYNFDGHEDESDDRKIFVAMSKEIAPSFDFPILTAGPHLDDADFSRVENAVRYEWNSNHSSSILAFEQEMALQTGRKYAIATSSCTGAMHLSLLAAGIGEGDEVLVPDITWVATASAVTYVGATPIFLDVDPRTWVVSADSISQKLTSRTKAIMPVHLYGVSPDMRSILELANKNGILVIEDAAPAIGSKIHGQPAGRHGLASCFSFQGAKIAVAGEGGAIVTDDEDFYKKARQLNDHGRKPGTFEISVVGHKYKPSNLACSLALSQLEKADYLAQRKRRINEWYRSSLSQTKGIAFQEATPLTEPNFWMTSISLESDAGRLAEFLSSKGVDTRPVFPPLSSFSIWSNEITNRNAKNISANSLNLPSGSHMTREMVNYVCKQIKVFLEGRD